MLIAFFSDIHGNREAFAACLRHAQGCSAERQVFLGDYVGYGADPGWVVDTVMGCVDAGAIAVMGNHDAAVTSRRVSMNAVAEIAIAWTASQLSQAQREFLSQLPLTITEDDRLYVHANAWAPHGWGYVLSREDAERSLLATKSRLTFCGHVHAPQLYHLSSIAKVGALTPAADSAIPLLPPGRWLAVLGAVGQPRDGVPAAC